MRLDCMPGTEPEIGTCVLMFTSYDGADRTRMLSQWYRITDHLWPGTVAIQPAGEEARGAFWTKWDPERNAPARPIETEPYIYISMIDEYHRRQRNGQ